MTTENWNSVLYDSMRSESLQIVAPVYYISWIFIGNFILLNLFLAILLDGFMSAGETEDDESEEMIEYERERRKLKIEQEKQRRLKKLGASLEKTEITTIQLQE